MKPTTNNAIQSSQLRGDYPFPRQCSAIMDARSESRAKRCGKLASHIAGSYFPVCATHARYLDPDMYESALSAKIAEQSQIIEELEDVALIERGRSEEWRRLARTKHGRLADENYMPVVPQKEYVYFVRSGEYIKIGKAIQPAERVKSLRMGGVLAPDGMDFARVELLAFEPGGYDHESKLHRRFDKLRATGEWFRAEGDLLDYISRIPNGDRRA